MRDMGPILTNVELLTRENQRLREALERIYNLRRDQCFGAVDWAMERGRIAREALNVKNPD